MLWHMGHEVLCCAFLANYMPKCQMSSGPYGPFFFMYMECKIDLALFHGLKVDFVTFGSVMQ